MKKVFLVRKDTSKPYGEGNWLIMNATQFKKFKETDEAKGRRFVRVVPEDIESPLIVKECEPDEARRYDTALKQIRRKRKYAKDHNIVLVPYSLVSVDGELVSSEELIPDDTQDIEEIVNKNLMIERLRKAIALLTPEEQKIIKAYYFSEEKRSVRDIAKELGLSSTTLFDRKTAILNKLRNFL